MRSKSPKPVDGSYAYTAVCAAILIEMNAIDWCILSISGAYRLMKPGIKEFHNFIRGPFKKQICDAFEHLEILSEADLQAIAWLLIRDFLRQYDPASEIFRVLNKPYFKDLHFHPDIAIFRRRNPWVLVELKERKKLTVTSAKKERARLIKAKNAVRPKRGYLIYVARRGNARILRGPKGPGAKFFFEIPIVLEDMWLPKRITEWEEAFHKWAKFAVV
jgi:hypothetical protein